MKWWLVAFPILGIALASTAVVAGKQTVTGNVVVNVNLNRHAINPLIYGVAWTMATQLTELGATINRGGGDNGSTYNWQQNAYNPGTDRYFESSPYLSPLPNGQVDLLVGQSQAVGAQVMVTVPMIGWIAKLGPNRAILPAFSQAKYGPQCTHDPPIFDAGDGRHTDCYALITGNDPNDAYVPDSLAQEQAWMQYMVSQWGGAANGGPRYYAMDNEPTDWSVTHRDIHPAGTLATEARDDVVTYAAMVKALDPNALIAAPEEWGWWGMLYSGADQQWLAAHGEKGTPPEQTQVQGGMLYFPWLLSQWRAAGKPVDVVTTHFYPSGGENSADTSKTTQKLRNRSTRILWDRSYVSEDWMRQPIALIPTLRSWVNTYYDANTPIGLTEYNWGAENDIGGATAQADLLGIFGREGLDMATRWEAPPDGSPTFKAMQLYRNYDGAGSVFGDVSVSAAAPDPDNLAVFAALRSSDGELTVMAINKALSGKAPLGLSLVGYDAGSAQPYQLTAANVITKLSVVPVANNQLSATLPAQSVTLYVITSAPAGGGGCQTAGADPAKSKNKKKNGC